MIKITITSIKASSSFVEEHPEFVEGKEVYYIIRESGKRISYYYQTEVAAAAAAWKLIQDYGLTLVEHW